MYVCSFCNHQVPADADFCPYCGSRINNHRSVNTYPVNRSYAAERDEALRAGEKALDSLYAAREELNRARNWGIIDLLGGGFISSMVKRSKMQNAQSYIEQAKYDLHLFTKELQDVAGFGRLDIDTTDFLSFADWFFDGFMVDFLVQEKIRKATNQVDEAIARVSYAIDRLQQI